MYHGIQQRVNTEVISETNCSLQFSEAVRINQQLTTVKLSYRIVSYRNKHDCWTMS